MTAPDRPADLLDRLRRPGSVLLDAPRPDADTGRSGALLFCAPVREIRADRPADVGPALAALDAALDAGHHVAGCLAYEAGYALDPTLGPAPGADGPLAWFGVYGAPERLDPAPALAALPPPSVRAPAFALAPDAYAARLAAVHRALRAGDVYQINLTAPVRFALDGDALALYAALRAAQPASYGAWLRLADRSVASVSPELFVRLDPQADGSTRATTRPMKGTAPRGATPALDAAQARALTTGAKDRAENVMIVDLLRNDLARVSRPGSVRVPALFRTEAYPTLTQMTSTVTSTLAPGATPGGVLRALFPCGSVTGAPKHRAMRLIRDLEAGPRGVYCGAIGYAAPDGTAAFSVAIRTAVVQGGAGVYGVGSGVVADSRAEDEYAECLLKARVLTDLAR